MPATSNSYVHGASAVPLLGETIGQNLDRTVAAFPDRDALVSVHQDIRLSYAQFHQTAEQVACGLLALGIEAGERVGIWSPNNAEWVLLQYATAKVGAILVNINPAYRTSELSYGRTTTSSTTASSSARAALTPRRTASASQCRFITVSGWSWAISPAPPTVPP